MMQRNTKGLSIFDPENMTLEDKRKWLENIVAMGEDIRRVLRDQIKYLKVGIGARHVRISERKNQVKDWFEAVAKDLEWAFDTKKNAAKFRNSYSISLDDYSSPHLSYFNTQSYEEQLDELDKEIEKGILLLEKMVEELKGQSPKKETSIIGDYVAGDKVGRDKNISKKDIKVDNSKGEKRTYWVEIIIAGLGLIAAILAFIANK